LILVVEADHQGLDEAVLGDGVSELGDLLSLELPPLAVVRDMEVVNVKDV
jgi:hypothetical protein